MKYLLILLLFPIHVFAEIITLECKAKGKDNYDNSHDTEKLLKLDTTKMLMKHNQMSDKWAPCKLSPNKEWYSCTAESFSDHKDHGGKYKSFYQINRRNLKFDLDESVTQRPSGQADFYIFYKGSCVKANDYQF